MTPEQAELFPDICRVEMCPHGIPENENERCVECMESPEEIETRKAYDFDGESYEAPKDKHRLNSQLRKLWDFMIDGKWHTNEAMLAAIGGSGQGVTARYRDFRKPRFGGHTVERRRVAGGLFEYRLIPNGELK